MLIELKISNGNLKRSDPENRRGGWTNKGISVSGKKKFIRKQLFYFYYNNYESSTFRNIMVSFDP